MDKTGGAGHIQPGFAMDCRNAQGIAFDADRRAQPGQRRRAIQLRQAAMQLDIEPTAASNQQCQQTEAGQQRPAPPAAGERNR